MRPQLWIDFETGGTNPWFHSPLSCAMIGVNSLGQVIGEWYGQIRQHPLNVTPEAMKINKLNLDHAGVDFAQFNQIYFRLINDWFYGGTNWHLSGKTYLKPNIKPSRENMPFFCGHNTPFDRSFLQQILGGSPGETKYDGVYYHSIDTMVLANSLQVAGIIERGENLKLETLCKVLKIEPVEGEMHNAQTDIRATRQCFLKMIQSLKEMHYVYEKVRTREDILQLIEIPSARHEPLNFNEGQNLQSTL